MDREKSGVNAPVPVDGKQLAAYRVPESLSAATREWDGYARNDFVVSERAKVLMDLVDGALASGLFRSSEVLDYCTGALNITAEERARSADKVVGGVFGMDIYYARRRLEVVAQQREEVAAFHQLGLCKGMQVGVVVFNDFKRITGAVIVETQGTRLSMEGKRGRYKVTWHCGSLDLKYAIERAIERGLRKPPLVGMRMHGNEAGSGTDVQVGLFR